MVVINLTKLCGRPSLIVVFINFEGKYFSVFFLLCVYVCGMDTELLTKPCTQIGFFRVDLWGFVRTSEVE